MTVVNIKESQIKINGLTVNFKTIGEGDTSIILLHGWGIDSDRYKETAKQLTCQAKNLGLHPKIIIPDLPGFGKSDEPKENWQLDDYVDFVDKFNELVMRKRGFELIKNIIKNFDPKTAVHEKKNNKIILIGHSFGGRIAIKYASKYPGKIEKLILTGAAGIKHPLDKKQRLFYVASKIGKKIFSLPVINKLERQAKRVLYKATREKDYFTASPKMKEVMKNALSEDLTPVLNQVNIPTLLVWGRDDRSTPLSDGSVMHNQIRNSKMIIIDYANHGLPYKKPEEFAKAVIEFIIKYEC